MDSPNAERPHPVVMWIVTPLVVLTAAFMYVITSDAWTTARIIGQVAFTTIAVGMVVATVAPNRGWWGLRVVAFVIFATYLWYLITEFVINPNPLSFTESRYDPSLFNAVLGFLLYGVPGLIYSMRGSMWGKLGHNNPKDVTRCDVVTLYIACGAALLFLFLSRLAGVAVLWK